MDWTDSCSDILWERYRVHARHTFKKLWNGHFWPNRPFFGHLISHFSKNIIYHQTTLCGYSRVVAGDAWHHAKQIYLFGFPNFDKTMKIMWKDWGFQIFHRFIKSLQDWSDICGICSDTFWQAYGVLWSTQMAYFNESLKWPFLTQKKNLFWGHYSKISILSPNHPLLGF